MRAVVSAIRLMKRIDRHVLGPSSRYLWREGRKRRYNFMYPPRGVYMLLPHLNLSPRDRIGAVLEEFDVKAARFSIVTDVTNV